MRNKWIYTIVVLALGLFASCSDYIDEPGTDGKSRKVVFRLSVSDAGVGSRAGTWGDEYVRQNGTAMENRIDLKGLRVAIYSINDDDRTVKERKGVADNILYWTVNDNTDPQDPIEYQLVGDISNVELDAGSSYRFMVYANFPHTTNNLFDLDDIGVEDGYIPMWGVTTHEMTAAELQNLGTIDLLRAAAKVEVKFAEEVTTDYTVSGLAIRNYNNTGNNLPKNWNHVASTKDLNIETCLNPTGSHVHNSSLPFIGNVDNGKYYIYIPEYNNAYHEADEQSVVEVTLEKKSGGNSKTYEIPFCNYNQGSPVPSSVQNIVRNHIYQFNVTDVAAGGLLLNFKVANWKKEDAMSLGSLAYPTYSNPVLPSKDHNYPTDDITTNPTVKYVQNGTSTSFEMYFNFINANGNSFSGNEYAWRPTIVDAETNTYSISVYKYNELTSEFDENPVYVSNGSGNYDNFLQTEFTGWFKIVVTPLKGFSEVEKFTFGISCGVHPSGFPSDDFFLFINGENNDIAWPESGTDRKFIVIKNS